MEINIGLHFIDSSVVEHVQFYWEEWDKQKTLDYPANVKGTLNVTFKNNSKYKYKNVPLFDVLSIVASESIGSSFHDNIVKKGYEYEKISLSQAQDFSSKMV